MNDLFSIAVSGLTAATNRLSNAAKNLVNISSTGKMPQNTGEKAGSYQPTDVISISDAASGGVTTQTVPRDPAYSVAYHPDSPDANAKGLVATPNVSIEGEIVDSLMASIAYQANAKVIEAQSENQKKLLDSLA